MNLKINILTNILRSIFRKTPKNREALVDYQNAQLEKQLQFLKRNSPYFSNLSFKSFSQVPIMNKAIMMRHFDELNTVGIKKKEAIQLAIDAERTRDFSPQINGITVGFSSGTSGNKGLFLASDEDKAKYVEVIYQKVLRPLKFRRTRVALFFRANSNLYESTHSLFLQFKYFDITKNIVPQIQALSHFNPHILVAPPTVLNIIAEYQRSGAIQIRPEKIISVAEVLEDDIKTKLEKTFKQVIHQLYQCTEGFLGSTCEYGTLHLHEDYVLFEQKWLDEKQQRFYPIISDFSRKTQPIIRYELNDILVKGPDCPCGSVFMPIKKIEGRSDDIFNLNDENGKQVIIFPDQIRNTLIIASDLILNYTVRQLPDNRVQFSLKTKSATALDSEKKKIEIAFKKLFEEKGVKTYTIVYKDWSPLPLHQKQRRIINRSGQSIQHQQ